MTSRHIHTYDIALMTADSIAGYFRFLLRHRPSLLVKVPIGFG